MTLRVGNTASRGHVDITQLTDRGHTPCSDGHDWGTSQDVCRGMQSSLVTTLHSGSRLGRTFDAAGYGPQRSTLKVRGGARIIRTEASLSQENNEAPSSSTTEQLREKTAIFGTSTVLALARVLNMDIDDSLLSNEQKALCELCRRDLTRSCTAYAQHATVHQGQQLLVDLKRMQNLVHRHLSVPGEVETVAANIYVISQGLTSILKNNKNLCYGNAPWRCWCWAGAFAEDANQAWGHTHTAVRQYLSDGEPQLLTGLQDMQNIWSLFTQDEQADAADFVHYLWSHSGTTFFGGRFFHRNLRGHVEEREQFPLNLMCPDGNAPISLDSLVNQWAHEGGGQYLYGSPGGLVLHIQRSALFDCVWTKHHREIETSTRISFPFSEDGQHVHLASYKVIGMVLHQGVDHQTGHYQSILSVDNIHWLADDEAYPQAIPHLSTQQRKEITQIWLALIPDDEMVPDTAVEIEAIMPKKPRQSQENLHIIYSNVTSFGRKVQDWLWHQGDSIMLFQETHLSQKALDDAMQYLTIRGWKCHGVPAEPTGRGGNTGGFLTVHSARHMIHHAHTYTKQGNGWTALRMERQGGDLFLIQIYLKTGETFQSPLNADLLGQLLQFLGHLKSPFMIGGDWQNSPEDLAATIPSKFRAQILAKDEATTLQGSHLDFILPSMELSNCNAIGKSLGSHIVLWMSSFNVSGRLCQCSSCKDSHP